MSDPTDFMEALLTLCSHGLPARLLLDVLVSQHIPEDLASTAIRRSMDHGELKLSANMNIVRAP